MCCRDDGVISVRAGPPHALSNTSSAVELQLGSERSAVTHHAVRWELFKRMKVAGLTHRSGGGGVRGHALTLRLLLSAVLGHFGETDRSKV